jgi:hypothetical protein
MVSFPPARLPTDPRERIEPIRPSRTSCHTSPEATRSRADAMLYAAGFKALEDEWLITDAGTLLQITDVHLEGGLAVDFFAWDGQSRRLRRAASDKEKTELLSLLSEAWPYEAAEGDALREEADRRLMAARGYSPEKDAELLIANFGLLVAETDKILSVPSRANGSLGGLSISFSYFGTRRFPISALLAAWRDGVWTVPCDGGEEGKPEHEAFVFHGSGGLGIGRIEAYCPTCGKAVTGEWSPGYFASISAYIPERSDGLRLDEIIEELGGEAMPRQG